MKRNFIAVILAALLVLAAGSVAFSQVVANPSRLADLRLLEMIIGDEDWVIIDCRPKKAYDEGHIPHSISLGDTCIRVLLGADLKPKPTAELERILGNAGASEESNIIVYGDTPNMSSALTALWVLGYLAHERVQYFNIEAWVAGGLPLVKLVPELDKATYKAAGRR